MKNRELFDKTVGILVRAYINGTLQSVNCAGCAVGNMIADAQGFSYNIKQVFAGMNRVSWGDPASDQRSHSWLNVLFHSGTSEIGQAWLASTGYSNAELAVIERTFESKSKGIYSTDTYDGLVAVYNALLEIHEADSTLELAADKVFIKPEACSLEELPV